MADLQPQVGCGAAIFNEEGSLLLIRRLTEPESKAWGLPGGKVDFKEPARIAVIREIQEELGIVIELTELACISEIIDKGDGRHWVSPVYYGQIISGDPDLKEPDKHGGWNWFALDDLPSPLTTPTLDLLQAYNREAK